MLLDSLYRFGIFKKSVKIQYPSLLKKGIKFHRVLMKIMHPITKKKSFPKINPTIVYKQHIINSKYTPAIFTIIL